MALYLVQHGKSLPKEVDPDKGLSEEGISEVKRIAGVAAGYGCKVGKISHSGKKRAKQTAEIFESYLKPENGVVVVSGLNPLDDVAAFSGNLSVEDNVMLVGHLPFMQRLTSYLIIGTIEPPVFKFQNGGIVCLDRQPDTPTWIIKWALMPNIS
ncbi:MAG: phosphohistidine phosphatase [Desulfatitalea sp. BRH_c12]|nr:MAG: phosphohistidine phosphatase [Desulfatitalea sp. BRH_c12]